MNGLASLWLWSFGLLLVAGRLLHARGLLKCAASFARVAATGMTVLVISIEGLVCLVDFAH